MLQLQQRLNPTEHPPKPIQSANSKALNTLEPPFSPSPNSEQAWESRTEARAFPAGREEGVGKAIYLAIQARSKGLYSYQSYLISPPHLTTPHLTSPHRLSDQAKGCTRTLRNSRFIIYPAAILQVVVNKSLNQQFNILLHLTGST